MLLTMTGFGVLGFLRLDIETDVVRSLPSDSKVVSDALQIFKQHPFHDQIAIDIAIENGDRDDLVACAELLEKDLQKSGLFSQVGVKDTGELIGAIAVHVSRHLPLLFSKDELQKNVLPLLEEQQIQERIHALFESLSSMEGIGQARLAAQDPLGLKDLVLAKMAPLAPTLEPTFYKNFLFSKNGKHLLLTARPVASGTDTASARKITSLLEQSFTTIKQTLLAQGKQATLTPVGAYRAALDNERIIRKDVQLALFLAMAGIAALLLFSFPRPLVGLLSLVPALAGTAAALFVYSLFNTSISIMVLGFGGAIISITVDHGIAYLLFLDRNTATKGAAASHEVRAIGIMAVITSIGAFLILSLSGFPIFTELGRFTALGILFSFLFVHFVFPKIYPVMPPAAQRKLPLRRLVDALYTTGKPGLYLALILAAVLLFFAKPQFHVSLSSMNTVSRETAAADDLFARVWGGLDTKIFLMQSAQDPADLQQQNDAILSTINRDLADNVLKSGFVPSMLFPGPDMAEQNLIAWKNFWNPGRVDQFTDVFSEAAAAYGFKQDGFSQFFSLLTPDLTMAPAPIPEKLYQLLGIAKNDKSGELIQFTTVQPGSQYSGETFSQHYKAAVRIFDPDLFTKKLANILFSTFTRMLLIICLSVTLLLLFFYLDLYLTLLTLLPAAFSFICTLGTLNLIGRSLDIPAMMLSVIIFGMGIDYSIFCVRAHQRYGVISHPMYGLVRSAVFLAGASTLIGFGVLCFAEHSLLRSIGVTSFLGIGYSLLGTFLLLPQLLKIYFDRDTAKQLPKSIDPAKRIRRRYSKQEAYPRMFARFKLQLDPMFADLDSMRNTLRNIRTIVDIGCGYGVPACWFLEHFPGSFVYGMDPDPERVRVAGIVAGNRGKIMQGWAPTMPENLEQQADLVLLLDMLHYLDDATVQAILVNSGNILASDGKLLLRFTVERPEKVSFAWRIEDARIRLSGNKAWYRSLDRMAELLQCNGFTVIQKNISSHNTELAWIIARSDKASDQASCEKNET